MAVAVDGVPNVDHLVLEHELRIGVIAMLGTVEPGQLLVRGDPQSDSDIDELEDGVGGHKTPGEDGAGTQQLRAEGSVT